MWVPASERMRDHIEECRKLGFSPEFFEIYNKYLEAQDHERQRLKKAGATDEELLEAQGNHFLCCEVLEARNEYLKILEQEGKRLKHGS